MFTNATIFAFLSPKGQQIRFSALQSLTQFSSKLATHRDVAKAARMLCFENVRARLLSHLLMATFYDGFAS